MQKWLEALSWRSVLVGVTALFLCWFAAVGLGYHPYECPAEQQSADEEPCTESFAARASFPLYLFNGFAEDHQGAFVGLGTITLALFTFFLWRATDALATDAKESGERAARAARKSAKAAKISAAVAQRTLEQDRPRVFAQPETPLRVKDSSLHVPFVTSNHGRSAGIISNSVISCLRAEEILDGLNEAIVNGVIGAGREINRTFEIAEDAIYHKDGRVLVGPDAPPGDIFFDIHVFYSDLFGVQYETRQCWRFEPFMQEWLEFGGTERNYRS